MKKVLKHLLKKLHSHRKSKPDIYIFSVPRSGSTLLAEILNSNSDSKTASEVFSLTTDNQSILKKYFDENSLKERYVDVSNDQYHQILNYFLSLSQGHTWNSFYWSDLFSKNHNYKTSRTIFKTHRITYYFDDLMNHYNNDFGIYLLRHPVAVSLSRMRMGWTIYIDEFEKSIKIKESVSEEIKNSIQEIKKSGSELEKQVLNWCLENRVFIQHQQNNSIPKNVIITYYENLIMAPEKTLKDLCAKIDIKFHPEMLKIIERPSSGIVHSKKEIKNQIHAGNKSYLTNHWKNEIDEFALNRIQGIIKKFGFDFYLEETDSISRNNKSS